MIEEIIDDGGVSKPFARYDATGHILYKGIVPKSMLPLQYQFEGDLIYEGEVDLQLDYILNGVATKRPVSPVTLTGQTLSNVPTGAQVLINGKSYDATASDIDLDFTYSGTYNIVVQAWPNLDAIFTVNVP